MRSGKLLTYVLLGLGGTLVLLLLAVVALLLLVNPDDYRTRIQQQASDAGIRLELAGKIGWNFYPKLGFRLQQIRLYPYDSDEHLLELGRMSLALDPLDLLSGKIRVHGMAIEDTELVLQRNVDGSGNWEKLIKPAQEPLQQEPKLPHTEQQSQQPSTPSNETARAGVPTQIRGLELSVVTLSNIQLGYTDQANGLEAGLQINDFVLHDFRFDQWFQVELNLAARLNTQAQTSLKGGLELRVATSLEKIEARELNLQAAATVSQLGEATQQIGIGLNQLLFDAVNSRVDIKGLTLNAEAQVSQLGQATQLITMDTDLGFGLKGQKVTLNQLEFNADLGLPQTGAARQQIRLAGEANLALATLGLRVPQLSLEAKLVYPPVLTQQLELSGAITALRAELQTLDINAEQFRLDIAGLAQLALSQINFSGKTSSLAGKISMPPFNPKRAADLIKLEDKRLSDKLPQTADKTALQQLALDASIKAALDPFGVEVSTLKLNLDDTNLEGQMKLKGTTSLSADLKLDTIDLDRYLPLQESTAQSTQPGQEQSASGHEERGKQTQPDATTLYSKNPILPQELLQELKLDARLVANQVLLRAKPFTAIKATARSDGKQVQANLRAQGLQGTAGIKASVNNLATTPSLVLDLDLEGIDLEHTQELLLDEPMLAGKGKVTTRVTTQGVSMYDWIHTLGGPVEISLDKGQLLGMNISKIFCTAASKAQGKQADFNATSKHTSLERLNLALVFNGKGEGTIKNLDLAIPDLGVTAQGQVDLPRLAFKTLLQIGISGNDLDASCQLPEEIKLPLRCEGQLFKESPLTFCRPDLSSIELQLEELLKIEKEKLRRQLEEDKSKAQEKLAAEERKAQQQLEKEKSKAQDRLKDKLQEELKKLF